MIMPYYPSSEFVFSRHLCKEIDIKDGVFFRIFGQERRNCFLTERQRGKDALSVSRIALPFVNKFALDKRYKWS